MREGLVRDRCGVCGELGNHGDVPHDKAMESHYNAGDRRPTYDVTIRGLQRSGTEGEKQMADTLTVILGERGVHFNSLTVEQNG